MAFDTFHNRVYSKLLCFFAVFTIVSSVIISPVNVIGQIDYNTTQTAEICDNGFDDNADGVVDGQREGCGPESNEEQEQIQGNSDQSCMDNATDCITTGKLPTENPQCPENGNASDCQNPNLAPIASAGNMQEVSTNESVSLNGLGSYDPDGNITSFHWVQTVGQPSVKLQDSDTIQSSFIAPTVSNQSLLTFQLTVEDDKGLTDTDSVDISVNTSVISDSSKGNQFATKTENGKTDSRTKTKFDTEVNKGTGVVKTESAPFAFEPYRYNKLGISLEHPPDWKFGSLKNGIQLIKEKNGVYVEIRKHDLESSNTNLKQYVFDDIKERSTERENFTMLNITETMISGNLPAYKTEYTFLKTENQKDFTINEPTNKILRFWTFVNGNAYTVAYVSENQDYYLYLPIALKIIETLKINPVSQQSFSDNDSKDNDNDSKNGDNDSKRDDDDGNDEDYEDKDGDGDIDCKDVDRKNFKVGPGDPGNLDGDGDGIGCET